MVNPGSPADVTWTVLITTFDRPAMLKRAIESAIAQTMPCEIIVMDDGSKAETTEVAAGFPQIVHIRNPVNLGHAASATTGITRAAGTWIKYIDDDDYLGPECLQRLTGAITQARALGYRPTMANCVAVNVDTAERPISTTRAFPFEQPVLLEAAQLARMMMLDQAPMGTPVQVAHERQAGLDAGGWPTERPYRWLTGDESEFWIRLAPRGDAIFMPDRLAYRTLWPGNDKPPYADRLGISLHLKRRLAEQIAGGVAGSQPPADIVRYLKLHWGLAAFRDGDIATGLKFALGGMFNLSSYRHILRRRRFADAAKHVRILD